MKREAIRRSGNYKVWSLSYKDVQEILHNQGEYYTETLDYNAMPSGASMFKKFIKSRGIEAIPFLKMGNTELLMQYLSIEHADNIFACHAEAYLWSLIDMGLPKRTLELAVWTNKIKELNQTLFKSDKTFPFGSIWAPRDVNSHLIIYSGTDQKERIVFAVLNDISSERNDKYEAEWNGMWRFFNIMQFLSGFMCVSTKGLNEYAYSPLADVHMNEVTKDSDCLDEWNEIFEMLEYSGEDANNLVKYAMENNIPKPEIGYEAVDDNDRVIGEIEIAWTEQKIGYLSEEQQEYSEILKSYGWRFIITSEVLSGLFNGGEN